jgi:hypothetical protein
VIRDCKVEKQVNTGSPYGWNVRFCNVMVTIAFLMLQVPDHFEGITGSKYISWNIFDNHTSGSNCGPVAYGKPVAYTALPPTSLLTLQSVEDY